MTLPKIFIDGEAGTTGLQIQARLAGRKDVRLLAIEPDKRKDRDARYRLLNEADVAILCLPDEAASEALSLIDNPHTRVIDASTAHRTAPGWVYGFPEMAPGQPGKIASAMRLANPGCYPQGLIALVRPLIEAGLLPPATPITLNALSGYSGGGRSMIEAYEAAHEPAPYLPYGLTFKHKHLAEMRLYSGLDHDVLFQPAVGAFAQGMLTFVPLMLWALPEAPTPRALHAALAARYEGEPFIEVAPFAPAERLAALDPRALNGTNRMRLYLFGNEETMQALLVALYDNLGKGASGAAVQNLNLMLGREPGFGLDAP